MENELTKDNIKLTHVLLENGQWSNVDDFNWEWVNNVEILNSNYCILSFGDSVVTNHQFTLYKYKAI